MNQDDGRSQDHALPGTVDADRQPRIVPTPLSAAVTAQMSRMPRKNTGPELALRRAMHRIGLRFLIHGGLPGRPDVVFTRAQIAVFVDGCFWHLCPEHSTVPKNNRDWWFEKLNRNVARDAEKDVALEALGWLPVHVWEHESPDEAARKIRNLWTTRRLERGVEGSG